MTNPILRAHFVAAIRAAAEKAEYVRSIDHAGMIGSFREIFARGLLEPLLPSGFAIGRGKIVDYLGNESAECDVVIYNRNIMPSILFDERNGLFPLEACIYAIEVKSRLTSKEVADVVKKFRRLWSLRPLPEVIDRAIPDIWPRTALFAFSSELSEKSELERYSQHDAQPYTDGLPACLVHCTLGRAYSYWNQPHKKFRTLEPEEEFEEVIDFLTGVSNTLLPASVHRKCIPFGRYICRER